MSFIAALKSVQVVKDRLNDLTTRPQSFNRRLLNVIAHEGDQKHSEETA